MNLTFKGFLRGYCRELTGLQTDNLKKLLSAVLNDAPAASEAVMVFAAAQGKAMYLSRLAEGTPYGDSYAKVADGIGNSLSLEAFLAGDEAPERYRKVWLAYCARKDAAKTDRRVIALMRDKTLAAMRRTSRTAYGICKELGLNRGNVYAYLNGGDVTKVSRETARRIMEVAACDI